MALETLVDTSIEEVPSSREFSRDLMNSPYFDSIPTVSIIGNKAYIAPYGGRTVLCFDGDSVMMYEPGFKTGGMIQQYKGRPVVEQLAAEHTEYYDLETEDFLFRLPKETIGPLVKYGDETLVLTKNARQFKYISGEQVFPRQEGRYFRAALVPQIAIVNGEHVALSEDRCKYYSLTTGKKHGPFKVAKIFGDSKISFPPIPDWNDTYFLGEFSHVFSNKTKKVAFELPGTNYGQLIKVEGRFLSDRGGTFYDVLTQKPVFEKPNCDLFSLNDRLYFIDTKEGVIRQFLFDRNAFRDLVFERAQQIEFDFEATA